MGDGGAVEGAAVGRGMFDSLLERYVRRDTAGYTDSLRLRLPANPLASSSTRPSYLTSAALDALQRRMQLTLQCGWQVLHWLQAHLLWKSTWTRSILILGMGATVCVLAMYCYVRLGSTRQIQSLYELKEGLNAGTSLNGAEFELESDEYEFEDDSEGEASSEAGHTRPLRRLFHLRNGHRRSGSKDTVPTRRSGSIVRITSSDPRSSLSSSPIQFDLESKSFLLDAAQDPSTASIVQQSGSVARRRRESGRLLNGPNSSASPNRTSTSANRNSITRATSPLAHPSSPRRPTKSQRRVQSKGAPDGSATTPSSELPVGGEEWSNPSPSASSQSFASAGTDYEEEGEGKEEPPQSTGPPSILKQVAQSYASIPRFEISAMYNLNANLSWMDSGQAGHSNDASNGSFENDFSFMLPMLSEQVGRLPPGAGRGPAAARSGPASPRLGSLTAEQARAIWPEKRSKSIRLQEPDWTPYVEVHDRARERLEAAAHVAANPRSASPLPPFSNTLPLPVEQEEKGMAGQSEERTAEEEEFWFERYSQSTAAAGRDWDWRKRRKARQMAAAAAAAGTPMSSFLLHDSSSSGAPSDTGEGEGDVGLTDVQLQHQRNEHAIRTRQQQEQQQQHMYALNNGEEGSIRRPTLTVATSDSYLRRGAGDAGGANGRLNSSSSLTKALRLKRYSSPDAEEAHDGGDAHWSNGGLLRSESSTDVAPRLQGDGSGERRAKKGRGDLAGLRMRRSSELSAREAKEAMSVPNRLSSLTPKMVKRSLSAKRERDAAITAQLLAEAEEVGTDEDEQERQEREEQSARSLAPHRGGRAIRKSASSSLLNPSPLQSTGGLGSQGNSDVWRGLNAAWSSADAYGPSPTTTTTATTAASAFVAPSHPLARQPSMPALMGSPLFIAGSQELSRQGSKQDSQSSTSSTLKQQSPQDPPTYSAKPRSGSRKGILSSATRATVGEQDLASRRPYGEDSPMTFGGTDS